MQNTSKENKMTEEIKTVVEVDCTTGEQIVRAMTTEELADLAITTAQAIN